MNISEPSLFIEINNFDLISFVGRNDEKNNFEILYSYKTPISGIEKNRISDFEKFFNLIKENIYHIEKKSNFTFKEIVLILDNFNFSFINLSGFKKLNGSQILREDIAYILNNIKSFVEQVELNKTLIHIFNSKFNLDNKKIENLPIGLFGDFYSQELSMILLKSSDFKNLKNIFEKCNLRIKKIYVKSFIKGANLSINNNDRNTFFYLDVQDFNSKIFFFENNSLKFEQNFNFGLEIIIKDICKITSLKEEFTKKILEKINISDEVSEDLVDKEYFKENSYRKIKKKLLYDIVLARLKEILELILLKNPNLYYYKKFNKSLYIEMNTSSHIRGLEQVFRKIISSETKIEVNFIDSPSKENLLNTAHRLVHFGWDKEAIPVSEPKKTLIARIFDTIFH